MKLRLSETFTTIQGEGKRAGAPSLFIRTSSCNLRCWWCDTPYTSHKPEGGMIDVEDLMTVILKSTAPDVVITGGEPMLWPEQIKELTAFAVSHGRKVTIETNGTICGGPFPIPTLWSVSPKLPSAAPAMDAPNARQMHELNNVVDYDYWRILANIDHAQLKFVLATEDDVQQLDKLIAKHHLPNRSIWAMPEGITRELILERGAWLAEVCKARGWNLCLRQHVLLWGNKRGT